MSNLDQEFVYEWLHIPTGTTGRRTILFFDQKEFLNELDHWNQLGGTLWKYTACWRQND